VATLATGLVLFGITISDRRRGYASVLAVWTELREIEKSELEWKSPPLGTRLRIDSRIEIENWENLGGPYSFSLLIKNGGQQPAYACSIRVHLEQDSLPSGAYPVIYSDLSIRLGIIAPETQLPPVSLLIGAPHSGQDFREALAKALTFELFFTDAIGHSWTRDQQGRLRRRHSQRSSSRGGDTSIAHNDPRNND
jgi:hypothetical protein